MAHFAYLFFLISLIKAHLGPEEKKKKACQCFVEIVSNIQIKLRIDIIINLSHSTQEHMSFHLLKSIFVFLKSIL